MCLESNGVVISIEDLLALIYIEDVHSSAVVAKVCDEQLDKSGALLGRVRDAVQIMHNNRRNASLTNTLTRNGDERGRVDGNG